MRIIILFLTYSFFLNSPIFGQGNNKHNYDSLWYFSPFSIDISAGTWTPIGKLSNYYSPSIQFGVSFGLKIRKVRLQYWIMPRILYQKKNLKLTFKDSIIDVHTSQGASIGGWFSYSFYKNKHINSEVMTGITYEFIETKRDKLDSLLGVGGVGYSIGLNTWLNTFKKLNFGMRTIYTYTKYNNYKNLATPIGGNSLTISLVYRFSNRGQEFKRFY